MSNDIKLMDKNRTLIILSEFFLKKYLYFLSFGFGLGRSPSFWGGGLRFGGV